MILKVKQLIKNYYKQFLVFMFVVWIIITYLAAQAFNIKAIINNNVLKNSIEQKTKISYKVEVIPNSLFPEGGLIESKDFIFTKLAKSIKIHIDSKVIGDKTIDVSGIKKVSLQLIANPYWKKDYVLAAESKFNLNGVNNDIFNNDYSIDIKSMIDFTQKVEIETGVRPDKYLFKIKPEVNGKILYDQKEIPLNPIPEITLQYGLNQIQIIGNSEYSKLNNIQEIDIIKQKYNIFGTSFSLSLVRYLFSFLSLVILIFIIYVKKKSKPKVKKVSKDTLIYNKYIDRIIPLKEDLVKTNVNLVKIDTLKSLIRISNEKELPMFSFCNNENLLNFYIIDNKYVYNFEIQ